MIWSNDQCFNPEPQMLFILLSLPTSSAANKVCSDKVSQVTDLQWSNAITSASNGFLLPCLLPILDVSNLSVQPTLPLICTVPFLVVKCLVEELALHGLCTGLFVERF